MVYALFCVFVLYCHDRLCFDFVVVALVFCCCLVFCCVIWMFGVCDD